MTCGGRSAEGAVPPAWSSIVSELFTPVHQHCHSLSPAAHNEVGRGRQVNRNTCLVKKFMCLIGGILGPGAKWVRKLSECRGRYLDIKEVMWPRLEYLGASSAPVSLNQQLFAHSPSPSKGVLFTLESLGSSVIRNSGRLVLSPGRFTPPPSDFLSVDHPGWCFSETLRLSLSQCCVSKRNNTLSRHWLRVNSVSPCSKTAYTEYLSTG